jgi:Ca2+-binding RTX toxin-like protein
MVRASAATGPTAGDDVIAGTGGDDVIDLLAGNDIVYARDGADVIAGGDGADEILGEGGDDSLAGDTGADTLSGGLGNDLLVGGADSDVLKGGAGADTYRFGANWGADIIDDSAGATEDGSVDEIVFDTGIDSADIKLGVGPNLPYEPDLLILNAATGDQILVRNYFGTELGKTTNDHIEQIRFADGTVWGAAEIRSRVSDIVGTEQDDWLPAVNFLNTHIRGLGGNDTLSGGDGNDVLDGGAGDDWMDGGNGDDTFIVDSTNDTVEEFAGGGIDLVQSSVTWTLGSDVENLTLTGTSAIDGTGNNLANAIVGNAGNNTLNGMAGADTLTGGAGNDTYVIDNVGDVIAENAGEGSDLVRSSITYTLAVNFENLTLTGSAALNATGNDVANVLVGNSGANILDGGLGADDMTGGSGNDTFLVDNTGDVVHESSSGGTDVIRSSVTVASLASNVEQLVLLGSANIDGTGNSSNNTLTGNSGNNRLNGGSGTDTLIGGLGDDTYVVDSTTDTITELAGQGIDTVEATVTFSINTTALANVENLNMITGTTATGNALNNVITGNSAVNTLTGNDGDDALSGLGGNDTLSGGNGNDILDGGTGNDGMTGGAGDDTFVVDSTTDTVTEAAGGGTDTIQTTVTLSSWAANVENMTLLGTGNLNTPTTTSSVNNVITGNSWNNTIDGGSGDDTLTGGAGSDSLTGGLGADTYRYASGDGVDTINNVAADSLIDRLQFTNMSSSQASFAHVSSNLVITLQGGGSITVSNWFTATANRIDFLNFTNGEYTANQVDSAANGGGALNGFAPPAAFAAPVTRARALGDFSAGMLQNGPGEDMAVSPAPANSKTLEATVTEGKQGGLSHVHWGPIKDFLTHAPTSLGDTLAAGDRMPSSFGYDDPHAESATILGAKRLIDAIALFGAERNVAHVQGSELGAFDPLEQLAAQRSLATGREFDFRHAALD